MPTGNREKLYGDGGHDELSGWRFMGGLAYATHAFGTLNRAGHWQDDKSPQHALATAINGGMLPDRPALQHAVCSVQTPPDEIRDWDN